MKLIIGCLLACVLLGNVFEAASAQNPGTPTPGADCSSDTTFCDSVASLTCKANTCKVKAGETCTAGANANCIEHSTCTTDGSIYVCSCDSTYTASSDKTECTTTPVQNPGTPTPGADCSSDATFCDSVASLTCKANTCKVKINATCTAGANANCIEHSTCKTVGSGDVCSCDSGFTASTDKTQCTGSGGNTAGGLVPSIVSLTLLVTSVVYTLF